MYGNKRKEEKSRRSVIKMYKAAYLRALPAATKDAGGALGKLLHTKGAAKARAVYSLYTLVGFENILLEVNTRCWDSSNRRLVIYVIFS